MATNTEKVSEQISHDLAIAYMQSHNGDLTPAEYATKYLQAVREIYEVVRKASVLF